MTTIRHFGKHSLDLAQPQVMGILNITPDSFSDGGELLSNERPQLDLVQQRAEAMLAEGVSILDVGGESTRPGAEAVSSQQEMDRVLPVLEMLGQYDVIVSLDTSNPALMKAGAAAGAGLINDVRALEREGALAAAAAAGLPVCLMHMQGQPSTMQQAPEYRNVVREVMRYLAGRVEVCEQAGISRDKILLDPGFGFGKTLEHNLQLLNNLALLQELQLPVLAGLSRKRMLGAITGRSAEKDRVIAGVAAAVIAVRQGACIIRTHDVAETMDAIKVCRALLAHEADLMPDKN